METIHTTKESKETFKLAVLNLSNESTNIIKRADHKSTDLGEILKANPLRPYVYRTTMKPVARVAGGFGFHAMVLPSPTYLFKAGFDPDFDKKLEIMEYNIETVKARVAYDKLNDSNNNNNIPRIKPKV